MQMLILEGSHRKYQEGDVSIQLTNGGSGRGGAGSECVERDSE
jgi:hypothetical protein